MDDLISRAAVLKALGEPNPLDYNACSDVRIVKNIPSVPAVPLDKLCEYLSHNCFMHCHICADTTGFCKEFEEASICGTPERWKAILTKWMEEIDE